MKKTRNLLIILLLSALVILGLTSQVKAVKGIETVEDLADAFETIEEGNVQVTGKTLKLLKDVTIDTDYWSSIPFVNGFEGTIDLNGNTISAESGTGEGNDYCYVVLDAGAKLTVEDSSSAKEGKVNELYFAVVHENSALTVNGGIFIAENYNNFLFNVQQGYTTINNGTFNCICGINTIEGNVIVNNGTFNTESDAVVAILSNLTINDGTFKVLGRMGLIENELMASVMLMLSEATINGGTFEGSSALLVSCSTFGMTANLTLVPRNSKVTVNGGEFVGYNQVGAVYFNDDEINSITSEFVINGGTFTGRFVGLASKGTKGLSIKGGKYASTGLGDMNYGAICVMAETEEEAKSILANGYKLKGGFTLKEIEGEEMWCTTAAEEVKPEKYNVKVEPATNGSVGVDKTLVAPGEEVAVVAEPNEGYEVDTITVKTAAGVVVEVSNNAFVMPIDDVVVSATFKTVEKPVEPKEPEEKDDTPKTGCAMPNMFVALFAVLFK